MSDPVREANKAWRRLEADVDARPPRRAPAWPGFIFGLAACSVYAAVALSEGLPNPEGPIFSNPATFPASSFPPIFEFAPTSGSGMGSACGTCANMMANPESLDVAPWTLENSGAGVTVITVNAKQAPNGTLTAERLQIPATTAGQWSAVFQQPPGTIYPGAHSGSMYVAGNGAGGATDLCLWNGSGHTCTTCNFLAYPTWTVCTVLNVTPSDATLIFTFGNGTGFNGSIARSALDLYAWGGQVNSGANVNSYTPLPTGTKGEVLIFSRASAATCLKTVGGAPQTVANGDMVTCANGQPRVMPGADGTSVNGLLDETGRTNVVLHSQDFPDVSWANFIAGTGTNPSKGGADSDTSPLNDVTAEKVTFNITNASSSSGLSQTILTAVAYSFCGWARGNATTNSGTFDICMDNASTATCAACSYVLGNWAYCKLENVTSKVSGKAYVGNLSSLNGGTTRSAQTPTLWGFQAEAGSYCSSYIATTTASAARVADLADLPIALPTLTGLSVADSIITPSDLSALGGSVLVGTLGDGTPGGAAGSTDYFTGQYSGGNFWNFTHGVGTPTTNAGAALSAGAHRYAVFHTGTLLNNCIDGVCGAGNAGTFSSPTTFTRFRIGAFAAATNNMGGITKRVCIDRDPLRCR
jgi:hypothetical protein